MIDMNNQLAPHETLELHELLSFKTVCMTKAQTMQNLVSDAELKQLLQEDVRNSVPAIEELKNLLTNNPQH